MNLGGRVLSTRSGNLVKWTNTNVNENKNVDRSEWCSSIYPQTIQVWYKFTYMKTIKNQPFTLGKYTVRPMDPMGIDVVFTSVLAKILSFRLLPWVQLEAIHKKSAINNGIYRYLPPHKMVNQPDHVFLAFFLVWQMLYKKNRFSHRKK